MSRPRHRARPVNYPSGKRIGWGVFPAGDLRMAVGYIGRLARLRAGFRAYRLNRRFR